MAFSTGACHGEAHRLLMEPTSIPPSPSSKGRGRPRGPGTSKRFAYLVLGLVVVGILGWLLGKPAYRNLKARRAADLVAEANSLAKQGKWTEASQVMRTAAGLAPTSPEVLRVSGQLSARSGSPSGLMSMQALLRSPEATYEDRLEYLRMALDFNRIDLTGPEITSMWKDHEKDPAFIRILIRHLVASGKLDNAVKVARDWLSRQPNDPEVEFILGQLLVGSNDPTRRQEGQRLLMGLAVGRSDLRNEAVDILVRSPDLPRAETRLLLKELAERTNSQIAIANLTLRLHPDQRAEVVEQIAGLATEATSSSEILRYIAWLRENGEWARIPELLTEDRVQDKPELLTVRLEALILSDRVNEAMPYLQMAEPPVAPYLQHCLNALAAERQGRNYLVRSHFDRALDAAGDSIPHTLAIASYAEKIGHPMAAIAAYQRIMAYPPMTVQAGRQIMRLVGPLDDLYTVRDTLKKLSAFMPQDDNYFLGSTYASFLLGETPAELRTALERRANKEPDQKLYQMVMALGHLKSGNHAEALRVIEGASTDWDHEEPRWRALYAAILGANQQREAARVLAARVDQTALKSAELDLIKPWLPK